MPDFSPANGDTISIEGTEYRIADLSFSDLRVHYFTGVSVRRLGDQHSKSSGYRFIFIALYLPSDEFKIMHSRNL